MTKGQADRIDKALHDAGLDEYALDEGTMTEWTLLVLTGRKTEEYPDGIPAEAIEKVVHELGISDINVLRVQPEDADSEAERREVVAVKIG